MNLSVIALITLSVAATPSRIAGQTTAPDQVPPRPPTSAPVPSAAPSPVRQLLSGVDRPVSWKLLLPNIVGDQERIWSFPARLAQGQS